jgi:hypothetical protein
MVRSVLILLVIGALGLLTACGGGGSTPVGVPVPPAAGQNVVPISVNGGPLVSANPPQTYVNGAFVSVNVCVPGTSTCQTIDDVLVDTGSFGLRLLASQVTVSLPVLTDGSGNTLNDCIQFLDNSFLWGNVAQADVKMAGEVASATSVQLIATPAPPPTGYLIPAGCTGTNEDTQQTLGANGILGVGPEPFDCGTGCDQAANPSGPIPAVYYLCSPSTGCGNPTYVSCGALCGDTTANSQVTNPVFNFTGDNNGVILELPAVTSTAATVSGSLIFGIGTQSNNALGSAAVLLLTNDNFTTVFSGQNLTASFIDSGSNGLFFPNGIEANFPGGNIPTCPVNTSFYCPGSLTAFSATNESGSTNSPVNFSVDDADTLFTNNNAAFVNLAGPQGSGACSNTNTLACSFDWGLPFFYGRNVYTAIDGVTPPTGVPAGPFEAY